MRAGGSRLVSLRDLVVLKTYGPEHALLGTVLYDCLPKLHSISKLYCRRCMFLVPGTKGVVTRVYPGRLR